MRYGAKAYLFRSMPFLGSLIEQEKNFYFVCGCSWKYKESMMIFFFPICKRHFGFVQRVFTRSTEPRVLSAHANTHTPPGSASSFHPLSTLLSDVGHGKKKITAPTPFPNLITTPSRAVLEHSLRPC